MMPKPAMPPLRKQRENNLPSAIMVLSILAATVIGAAVGFATITTGRPKPPRGLELGYHPKVEFIDFTGQIRYGKDKSTGFCFANIRTADSDPRVWRTFARVPCEALERLK